MITGSGKSGEGNGNPLQYSCLETAMDRGAWQATVHGIARLRHDLATKPTYLYTHTYTHIYIERERLFTLCLNIFTLAYKLSIINRQEVKLEMIYKSKH